MSTWATRAKDRAPMASPEAQVAVAAAASTAASTNVGSEDQEAITG